MDNWSYAIKISKRPTTRVMSLAACASAHVRQKKKCCKRKGKETVHISNGASERNSVKVTRSPTSRTGPAILSTHSGTPSTSTCRTNAAAAAVARGCGRCGPCTGDSSIFFFRQSGIDLRCRALQEISCILTYNGRFGVSNIYNKLLVYMY